MRKKLLFLLTLSVLASSTIVAQAPANDNCSGAITLTVNSGTNCTTTTTGNLQNATQSLPPLNCNGNTAGSAYDVWYSFVATSTTHKISVTGSTGSVMVIDLRSGTCNGTNINCNMTFTSGGTAIVNDTALKKDSTYYVRIYNYQGGAATFTICVTTPTPLIPPANDNCSGAVTLTVSSTSSCGGATAGTTANATQSIASTDCGSSTANDVWYSFVATATQHAITVAGSSNDNVIADLRSGACNGTGIYCNIAISTDTAVINATGLTVGDTYYVRVYYYNSTGTAFTICVTTLQPPSNDDCPGATALTVSTNSTCTGAVSGTVKYATQSLPVITCYGFDAAGDIGANGAAVYTGVNPTSDVWYKFVASSTDHNITVTGSPFFQAVIDVRSGTCNGTNIDCGTADSAGATLVVSPGDLTIGNTYYIRIYEYNGSTSTPTFTVCVTTPAAKIDAVTSTCPRAIMVNNYYNKYLTSTVSDSELVWTGDTATCNAGTISTLAKKRTVARINYFRELVGLPDTMSYASFVDSLNAMCQKAALIMNANNQLSHFPPTTWKCYTDSGHTAARWSNLALGKTTHSSNAVSEWMDDAGNNNYFTGHRRWIIFSRSQGPYGMGSTIQSSALWVVTSASAASPVNYVAYPSAGFFPAPLVPTSNRWSFGADGADFTNTSVQMTDNSGANVPTTLETLDNGYGDNTIVWRPTGIVTDSAIDLAYTVHVNNVVVGGITKNYTYTVTICPISYPPQCPAGKSWSENHCACITPCTPVTNTISPTVCPGQSVTVGTSTYSVSGTYTNTLTSYKGCDSVVTTKLTVLPANTHTQSPTVCAGQSVTVGTATYSVSGTFTTTLTSKVNGCDSTVTTNLTVLPANTHTQSPTVCSGQSVTVGSSTYTVSGTYTNTFTASNGCDSTIITKLTVYPANSTFNQSPTLCPGQSITVGPNTYTATGTYTNTLTSSVGCGDSVVVTHLTVLPSNTFTQSPVICAGQSVTVGTTTYTVTGTFTNTLTSYRGCDSVVTTNLTVNPLPSVSSTVTPSATICSGMAVTLNGVGATSYTWSGGVTDGTSFVPSVGTTTYTVTGTTNGCSGTSTKTIVVNAIPLVSSTVTPLATVCFGTSVTLNGTGATSYTWSGGVTNGASFAPAVGTGTYTVTGTSNGCSGMGTHTIVVNPIPAVSSSVTPSATVCSGTAITLNGAGTTSYTWSGGVTDGTSFVPAVGTSTYTVTGTTNGCSSTGTQTIVVNPIIIPAVSIAITSGNNSTCTGQSITFTAAPTNGGTTPAYQWTVNNTNVGTNSNTFSSTSLANGDIVVCQLTSDANCANPITATSNSITMNVTPTVTPAVSISISSGSNPTCAGSSITFTAAPTNGGTTPTYQWTVNGASTGTSSATYTSSSLANGDVIACVLNSNANCTNTATATSNTITISVTTNTVVSSVTIVGSSNSICAGTVVTFTATPTNGGATSGYQWMVDGGNVGTSSPTYTSTALTNGQVVSCSMTTTLSCGSLTSTSNSITMNVTPTVTPSVSIAITSGSNPTSAGQSITFSATPTNGGSTPAYQWKLNNVNVGTNSATYTSSGFTNGDAVSCVLTSNVACASTATVISTNTISVTVTATVTYTTTVHVINTATAMVKSNVTINGGLPVTAKGTIWSTSPNPTTALTTKTTDAGGTAVFTDTITGLLPATTYYVRTYATNANGTVYSNEVVYTTPPANTCSPDPSITLATPGIFPKSLPPVDTSNLTINQTFTYSVPFTYTNKQGMVVYIDSSFLTGILNLPPGLSYQCGRPNCIFYPGEIGCFVVSGTLPNVNNQRYYTEFKVTDYGVINTLQYGPQELQTYSPNYTADTMVFTVNNSSVLGIETFDTTTLNIVQCSPNPFSNDVTVKFTTPETGNVDFYINDIYGRELYRSVVNAFSGINTINYSSDNLSAGSYYFTIANSSGKQITKMMIAIK